MTALRLIAYAPNGARIGPLPTPQNVNTSYVLNDAGALTLEYAIQAPMAGVLGQPIEVVTEVSTDLGQTWAEPVNGRFLYLQDGRDPVKADAYQITCPGYVKRLTKAVVPFTGLNSEGNRAFTAANPGAILVPLLTEAQARGALAGIAWDFTAAVDSAGLAWPATTQQTIAFSPGGDLYTILTGMAESGLVDFQMTGRTLQVYVAGTFIAKDRTIQANPVSIRSGRDLTEAPFRRTWEALADTAYVQGDNLSNLVRTNPAANKPWGRQEAFVQAGGVADQGTLTVVADGNLALYQDARVERTFGLEFGDATFLPFRDYEVGAWVYAVTDPTVPPERLRVRQITLTRSDQGVSSGNIVLNDRFVEGDILQARRLARVIGGGAIAGAGSTSTASSPVGNDILAPAKVLGLVASSSGYVAADGYARAQVTLDWADVTTNADGTPSSDIDHYEVERRRAGATAWNLYTETQASLLTDSPYQPGEAWEWRVRAVDTVYNRGAYSDPIAITMVADTTPPAKPRTPAVSVSLGVLVVYWDGKDSTGAAMALDTAGVRVWYSASSGKSAGDAGTTLAGMIPKGGGTLTVPGLPYDVPQFVFLEPIDTAGNVGTISTQAGGTPTRLVTIDVDPSVLSSSDVANPGFEDWPATNAAPNRWRVAGGAAPTRLTGASTLAGKQTPQLAVGATLESDPIPCLAGETYYLAATARAATATTSATLPLYCMFYDAAGAFISTGALTISNGYPIGATGPSRVDARVVAPAGTMTVAIRCAAGGGAAIQFDNVEWRRLVSSALIGDLQVKTANIADLAVQSAKIADLAVGSAKIADLAVTTAKITNLAVTDAKKITSLQVDKITTGSLSATIGFISGELIAGNAGAQRVSMGGHGIRSYNPSNVLTGTIDSATGLWNAMGSIWSGAAGTSRVGLVPNAVATVPGLVFENPAIYGAPHIYGGTDATGSGGASPYTLQLQSGYTSSGQLSEIEISTATVALYCFETNNVADSSAVLTRTAFTVSTPIVSPKTTTGGDYVFGPFTAVTEIRFVDITFGTPFDTTPRVMTNLLTSDPSIATTCYGLRTTTGFRFYCKRNTGTAAVTASWQAFAG